MQNVPKTVRERLKATPSPADHPPTDHPDANVLTAFSERVLPEGERAVVLAHIARCGDCRDVLALALPPTETVEAVAFPAPRRWLTWPVLRWGLVAAGVVTIAAFGIFQSQHRLQAPGLTAKISQQDELKQQSQPTARSEGTAAGVAADDKRVDQKKDQVSTLIAPADVVRGLAVSSPAPRPLSRADTPPAENSLRRSYTTRGSPTGGPRVATQWQQQSVGQMQTSVPAAPPLANQQGAQTTLSQPTGRASETVEVQAAAPQLSVEARNNSEGKLEDSSTPSQSADYYLSPPVGRAKAASTGVGMGTGGASASKTISPAPNAQLNMVASNVAPHVAWRIDAVGGLQRSFDKGENWHEVDVNANTSYSADTASVEVVAKAARAKQAPAAKEKDAGGPGLKRAAVTPTFRAVSAMGADVWAGGSGGVLYHSQDAGNHWTRVVPSSAGAVLNGDIIGVEFSGSPHGKVTTALSEVWITDDAGKTWRKQ